MYKYIVFCYAALTDDNTRPRLGEVQCDSLQGALGAVTACMGFEAFQESGFLIQLTDFTDNAVKYLRFTYRDNAWRIEP